MAMTASQARSFNTYSHKNAAIIVSSLKCECSPYEDVFTYQRWQAQQMQVQRGEHGIKIMSVRSYDKTDDDTGETKSRKYMGKASVFCRCQIKPK